MQQGIALFFHPLPNISARQSTFILPFSRYSEKDIKRLVREAATQSVLGRHI
jgi:hypothetical protein